MSNRLMDQGGKKTSKVSPAPPSPAMTSAADERKWRAEDALSTITRASQYQSDKTLMKDVAKLAREKAAGMAKIADMCGPTKRK